MQGDIILFIKTKCSNIFFRKKVKLIVQQENASIDIYSLAKLFTNNI